jgi:uncharacterized protein (AIM24 family)
MNPGSEALTMAKFEVHELEGSRYVDITLENETVRAEAGALCCMTGNITLDSRLIPSISGLIKSLLADEAVYRPTYTGTGVVSLESSYGGFHVIELSGQSWILEKGTYWASDGTVDVSFHRERILTSLWAGEGLVYLQTKVRGHGKVVLTSPGPIEEITLEKGKSFVAEGKYVVGRTSDVSFKVRRATKSFLGKYTAGEGLVRVYGGPGTILLNPTPYWRYRLLADKGARA